MAQTDLQGRSQEFKPPRAYHSKFNGLPKNRSEMSGLLF